MASAAGSLFARTYAGHTGVDPVHDGRVRRLPGSVRRRASSRARGCTTSTRSWRRSTDRVPENALLSHDLFEGLYARTALVTDVEVVDDYPSSVLAHARRQHRWVRGDWQILLVAVAVRAVPLGPAAQPPAADRALEDPRQPAAQPAAPGDGGAAVAGWTVLPGHPARLDRGRPSRRSRFRSSCAPCEALAGPRRGQSRPRLPADRRRRSEDGRRPRRPAARVLANQAYERLHAIGVTLVRLGVTRHGCSNGKRRRPARPAAGRRACGRSSRDDREPGSRESPCCVVVAASDRPRALPSRCPCWRCGPRRRLIAFALSRPAPGRRADADSGGPRATCTLSPARPGATSRLRRRPRTTPAARQRADDAGPAESRTARRRPTSAWACSRPSRRTISGSSTQPELVRRSTRTLTTVEAARAVRGASAQLVRHARRSRRCRPATSPPSTAATSRVPC